MISLDLPRTTPRGLYYELHRQARIAAMMSQEVALDTLIYGAGYQFRDETGIYNLPPAEVFVNLKSGEAQCPP